MDINPENFHKSITDELKAVQDRVRSLIGGAHWGEEGRYKEAILSSVIRRFLPKNMSLGTGFIIKKENNEIKVSNQIDIIIYENTYPVLFEEGDFLITTPENVKGIIEVKTNLSSSSINETVLKATSNGKLIAKEIFNGIFVYDKRKVKIKSRETSHILKSALINSKGTVNHLCFGENIFIKFWQDWNSCADFSDGYYSIYKISKLSFSYFISNLVEHISKNQMTERLWFLYPISEGKERYKIEDICV